jgi:hypothetical protein
MCNHKYDIIVPIVDNGSRVFQGRTETSHSTTMKTNNFSPSNNLPADFNVSFGTFNYGNQQTSFFKARTQRGPNSESVDHVSTKRAEVIFHEREAETKTMRICSLCGMTE